MMDAEKVVNNLQSYVPAIVMSFDGTDDDVENDIRIMVDTIENVKRAVYKEEIYNWHILKNNQYDLPHVEFVCVNFEDDESEKTLFLYESRDVLVKLSVYGKTFYKTAVYQEWRFQADYGEETESSDFLVGLPSECDVCTADCFNNDAVIAWRYIEPLEDGDNHGKTD